MKTSYFSHDSNARNSEKLIKVRMKHGASGYGVFFMILERLRESENYMSVKDYNVIAFDLRVDSSLIKSVIEDFGLFAFTDDGKCFYSEGLTERMKVKDNTRNAQAEGGRKAMLARWAKKEETGDNDKSVISDLEVTCNKKRKEKESKEEKKTTNVVQKKNAALAATLSRKEKFRSEVMSYEGQYPAAMLSAFFSYWTEMNASCTKMRFEQQPTWETNRRLSTWASRERADKSSVGVILRDNNPDKYNEESW